MRSSHGGLFALALSLTTVWLTGCAATQQVRYVYQDHDFGVIGMPENSDKWPTRYRHQAEKLMQAHFPGGHEIVRAEEVVEGTRTLTVQGTNTAEVLPALPTALFSVGRLGRSSCRSQADKLKLKECRIIYRRTGGGSASDCYAPVATLTPTRYVDPNEAERHPGRAPGAKADEADAEREREKEKEKAGEPKPEPPLEAAAAKGAGAPEAATAHRESEPAHAPARRAAKGRRVAAE